LLISEADQLTGKGELNDNLLFYRPNRVTFDFVRTLGMQIVAGRDFSREYPSDIGQACIINETAARYFGWEDPIGMRLDNNMYTVIGVIKDYHVMDIHNIIDPVVLMLMPDEMQGDRTYAFRIAPGYSDEAIALLTSEFSREFPDDPFFLGDLDSAFRNETAFKGYQTLKKSMLFFTVFNILLAVTGLLGLVSFSVARRTKEVGIRKITGSSIASIFIILNREFFILLAISLVIAWPGVWMVYNAFPGKYKLPLHPWILLSSALIILVITLMTTAWQTWRAATRNPVEALRYE
jgi:putative ABC transport system permease protein